MKHEALLKARKNALDDFITEGDDEYDIAEKAIDTFLDYLEKDLQEAQEVHVTSTGAIEIIESTNTNESETILGEVQGTNGTDVLDNREEEL